MSDWGNMKPWVDEPEVNEWFKVQPDVMQVRLSKEYNNKVPTHDPYTNPDSHIYYECRCGAILDPGTRSFASLNNHASEKGWKIRFGETGYTPYCVKCGEKVE